MRCGRERDLGACAGAQGERGFVLGKKLYRDAFLHAFLFFIVVSIGMTFLSCVRLNGLFPVISRLPDLGMKKERQVNTGCLIHVLCTPLLIRSSLGRIKRGSAHRGESEMYVGDNRPVFLVKYAANAFTGKACYRDT